MKQFRAEFTLMMPEDCEQFVEARTVKSAEKKIRKMYKREGIVENLHIEEWDGHASYGPMEIVNKPKTLYVKADRSSVWHKLKTIWTVANDEGEGTTYECACGFSFDSRKFDSYTTCKPPKKETCKKCVRRT